MPYPAKTIAKAKLQYSQGKSMREIARSLDINYQTVFNWADKYGWTKSDLLTTIEQKQTESILETASKLGATKEFVIKKALELAMGQNVVLPTGTGYTQIPINEDTLDDNGFMGLPPDSLVKVPDRKYQQEGNKLLADILKLRDRDKTTVIAPTPVLIKAEDGAQIAMLGFDSTKSAE